MAARRVAVCWLTCSFVAKATGSLLSQPEKPVREQMETVHNPARLQYAALSDSGVTRGDPPSAGCQLGAKLFGHGARVPRSDPCERCLCFAAQVICWQERCPNQTKPGCTERRMPGVCCPALECSDTTTPEKAVPAAAAEPDPTRSEPVVVEAALHGEGHHQQGCVLGGQRFALGDLVPRASGPCMQCRCADGPRLLCRATPCAGPVMLGSSSPRRPPPPTHTVRRIAPTLVLP
ncbi:hypothetical protein MTO96_019066 [Rhipicephalus appendiculatus]